MSRNVWQTSVREKLWMLDTMCGRIPKHMMKEWHGYCDKCGRLWNKMHLQNGWTSTSAYKKRLCAAVVMHMFWAIVGGHWKDGKKTSIQVINEVRATGMLWNLMKQILLLLLAQFFKNASMDVDVHSLIGNTTRRRWDISPIGFIANEYQKNGYTDFDQWKSSWIKGEGN